LLAKGVEFEIRIRGRETIDAPAWIVEHTKPGHRVSLLDEYGHGWEIDEPLPPWKYRG
jgi:hypothetical protein